MVVLGGTVKEEESPPITSAPGVLVDCNNQACIAGCCDHSQTCIGCCDRAPNTCRGSPQSIGGQQQQDESPLHYHAALRPEWKDGCCCPTATSEERKEGLRGGEADRNLESMWGHQHLRPSSTLMILPLHPQRHNSYDFLC